MGFEIEFVHQRLHLQIEIFLGEATYLVELNKVKGDGGNKEQRDNHHGIKVQGKFSFEHNGAWQADVGTP